jgi:hypothetical protein
MNFSKLKKEYLNTQKIMSVCSTFWDVHSGFTFALFSLVVIFLGTFFWYQSFYKSDWSSAEKEQYKKSQNKEVQLKEKELKSIMEEVDRRKNTYNEPVKEYKNIFNPYIGKSDLEASVEANINQMP